MNVVYVRETRMFITHVCSGSNGFLSFQLFCYMCILNYFTVKILLSETFAFLFYVHAFGFLLMWNKQPVDVRHWFQQEPAALALNSVRVIFHALESWSVLVVIMFVKIVTRLHVLSTQKQMENNWLKCPMRLTRIITTKHFIHYFICKHDVCTVHVYSRVKLWVKIKIPQAARLLLQQQHERRKEKTRKQQSRHKA